MMKHNVAIATGLASLLVLPAALGQEDVAKLSLALDEITHAIDVMTGIENRLLENPQQGIELVLSSTEPAHLEQRALDERLGALRKDVSLLQMELDALETPGSSLTLQPFVAQDHAPSQGTPKYAPSVITGLDDALRSSISTRESRTGTVRTPSTGVSGGDSTVDPGTSEFEGYTADPVGQARACYRVGRYQKGLDLLGELEDTTALYWKARCLERLERIDDAIALLERVSQEEGDTYEGRRAGKDLEFLKWKKEFLAKLPTGMQERRKNP